MTNPMHVITGALDELLEADHVFVSVEFADRICEALGVEARPEPSQEVDTRWMPKGLTITTNNADGFLDLIEYRRWVKANWDWLKPPRSKVSQQRFVDETYLFYTQPAPRGWGMLQGVPYSTGIDATELAQWLCRQLGVTYTSFIGRGFQLRECVRALAEHFELPEDWQRRCG